MSSHRLPQTSTFALALAALLAPVGASGAGNLAFVPASLDFGFNALGEIKTLTATLENGTTAAIVLNTATLADNPGGYVIASTTCGATLAAGQSCKYTLRYTAKRLQLAAARLELTTPDPAFPQLNLPLVANRYPALNDTGITRCGNDTQNGLTCPVPTFPEQDAQFGRDKTRNVASNGKAGFNYTKLDAKGKALPASAKSWSCVRDNVTGMVWEKKPKGDGIKGNQGLHDADDTYTWYSTDSDNNGGFVGFPNQGNTCFGYLEDNPDTFCNTEAFMNRVNVAGWCGVKDWRVATRQELIGLVDRSIPSPGPTIDAQFFPDAVIAGPGITYWSSSSNAYGSLAWFVSFSGGYSGYFNSRWNAEAVRLVRGDR